ncbi:MAG: imidazolonepropionase [bacterium]|nr:imidazolonepropionase [bacterium]
MHSVLIHNIGKLVTPLAKDKDDSTRPLLEFHNAAVLIEGGRFKSIGRSFDLLNTTPADVARHDANHKLMLPGFVDCHTHPVFVGNRAGEFFMRNRGASYHEIAESGGGIHASSRKIASASVEQIVRESLPRFEMSLAGGVTTIECKSGYGLTWLGEERLLFAMKEIEKIIPQRMSKTFLVHVIPQDSQNRRVEFVQSVVEEMIPEVHERKLASCVDIFCEQGAFSVEESRQILSVAKQLGMSITIHANQFGHSGGAMLASELGARSADHLEYLNRDEIEALQRANVVAVILPACVYFMNAIPYPPMRSIIDNGMRMAIATDMNPGTSMTESIPFCLTTAAIYGKLSIGELLWSVTLDAARVLGMEDKIGSIESGRFADFSLWNLPTPESLAYFQGSAFADEVWINGEQVFESQFTVQRY